MLFFQTTLIAGAGSNPKQSKDESVTCWLVLWHHASVKLRSQQWRKRIRTEYANSIFIDLSNFYTFY
jgi:hypothetical protein